MNFWNWIFPPKPKTNNDKFYYLALLRNDNISYGYSIHGFWPNYTDGTYPSYCRNIPFNFNKIQCLENDLLGYWELPGDSQKLELSFWRHEWSKHGTCMFCEMDEYEYFKKAIDLYEYLMNEEGIDIEKFKKGKNYLIPFDLNFKLISNKD